LGVLLLVSRLPNPEIERTFHRLKRRRQFGERFQEGTSIPAIANGEEVQRRALRDFVTPGVHGQTPSINVPPVVANNFDLKLALIFMVQQSQFNGSPMKDPNLHLSGFIEV